MSFQDFWLVPMMALPLIGANMLATPFGKMVQPPWLMDGGRKLFDSRPILGPGKTWNGFIGGIIGAMIATFSITMLLNNPGHWSTPYDLWSIDRLSEGDFQAIRHMGWLAFGALLGDAAESFLKRRKAIDSGQAWPGFDQFDAVIGGFGLSFLVDHQWFMTTFITIRWPFFIFWLAVYYFVHRWVSGWAYRHGLKTAPC